MNLNEVKKHVYFQIAIYIGVGLCLLLSMFAILLTPVKAMEQTTDITNQITLDPTVCNNSGGSGVYCVDYLTNRNVKTTYNGRAQCIGFAFNYYFMNSRDYTLNIIANSNDFRNNNLTYTGYSYTTYPGNATQVPVQGRFINKQKIQIVFPYDPQETHSVQICSSGSYMTGDTNYNIKQVYLTYDDGQQDISGIVDNATQNTTDIINNSNSNTESIISSAFQNAQDIINQIRVACKNLIDYNSLYAMDLNEIYGIQPSTFFIRLNNSTNSGIMSGLIPVSQSTTFTGFIARSGTGADNLIVKVIPYDNAKRELNYSLYDQAPLNNIYKFTTTNNTSYIRVLILFSGNFTGDIQIGEFSLFQGNLTDVNYCQYGTSDGNRLEDIGGILGGIGENINTTNDKLDDTYDYLTDNTQPVPDNNEISNVLGLVSVNDPLIYLTTLPITLLNKINVALNTNQCTDFNIGAFGVIGGINFGNYTFKFPCLDIGKYIGNSLWNTIDIIVGIGLLALSIYKFYHMITNILSLGAEEKASKISHYFTPMEFLSLIIEGDVPGITIRKGVINE